MWRALFLKRASLAAERIFTLTERISDITGRISK